MTTPITETTGTDDQSPMLAAAQTLLASRMEVIPPLAAAIAERKRLQGLLDAAEKTYGAAYAAAQTGGWTPEELRQMGADDPTRRPQGRPKGSRTKQTSAPRPRKSTEADAMDGASS
ncbi:hypothetical protein ABTY59_33570 [Streptomyces sp. NPDC096079]|uniref:hypothetical protein n=1 Tax=Streptomyces sp. NPDC096079 TaxID=3155820 RepID=UPI0033277366